jgi:hypothetical protein
VLDKHNGARSDGPDTVVSNAVHSFQAPDLAMQGVLRLTNACPSDTSRDSWQIPHCGAFDAFTDGICSQTDNG